MRTVKAKARAALSAGLNVILCVGESWEVRERGEAVEAVIAQLDRSLPKHALGGPELAIAYEPIWAIGTGKIPTAEEIAEMHCALRHKIGTSFANHDQQIRILYGGSVKASNAQEIFAIPDVDGALVGGASLRTADFVPIIAAARPVAEAPASGRHS